MTAKLQKFSLFTIHYSLFFRIFAPDMQITNQQINITLVLVAAGLLAVCIASVVSAIN
jgi:hypothetical protein